MRAPKYDVSRCMELARQGLLATGQHVKFSNDPNHIPDNSLEAQMARRLLWKRTSDRGRSGQASKQRAAG